MRYSISSLQRFQFALLNHFESLNHLKIFSQSVSQSLNQLMTSLLGNMKDVLQRVRHLT